MLLAHDLIESMTLIGRWINGDSKVDLDYSSSAFVFVRARVHMWKEVAVCMAPIVLYETHEEAVF